MRTTSPIWDKAPVKNVNTIIKETEDERWFALISDPDPLILTVNPLKYGQLTPEGFVKAHRSERYSYNAKWPTNPAAVVSLLLAVGADEDRAVGLLRTYDPEIPVKTWRPVRVLETYYLLLKQTGTEPSSSHLLKLLESYPWQNVVRDKGLSTVSEMFPAMQLFCSNDKEVDLFLSKHLPQLALPRDTSGEFNITTSLLSVFPTGGTDALITWLKSREDYQGLGYMVWQERYPLHKWLLDIAQSNAETLGQRRERVQTLLGILGTYSETPLAAEKVAHECQIFAKLYGHEVPNLAHAMGDDVSGAEPMQWLGTLTACGALPADHPAVTTWLTKASLRLDERCSSFIKNGGESGRTTLGTTWFRQWGPKVANQSQAWCDYLGKRLLLDVSLRSASRELDSCGSSAWLANANVMDVLRARASERHDDVDDLFTALVPRLSKEHLPLMGAYLTQRCMLGKINARTLRSQWKQADNNKYGPPIPTQFSSTDASLLLYALTRKDPKDVLVTMRELGVNTRSEAYRPMLETWLTNALDVAPPEVLLPATDFNTTDFL